MAKANLLDLPQTKSTFEIEGTLFNVASQNAFKVNDAGTWRTVSLGVRVNDGEVVFFSVKGGQKKTVWMSKRGEKKGDKGQTKEVAWNDRIKESRGGWQPMGISMGLEKDETGKNILVSKTEWDAFDYLKEHAVDGISVFVQGEIEFSTYQKEGETEIKHYTNLVAKKIYLKGKPIDFSAEGYKTVSQFTQKIVFNGVEKTEDGSTNLINAIILGWHSYQEVQFETTQKLVDAMKAGNLKKYNSLTVTGNIKNVQSVEEVAPTVVWGEDTTVKRATTSGKIVLLITGADGNSVESETYSSKLIEEYVDEIAKEKSQKDNKAKAFESQGGADWGDKKEKVDVVAGWGEEEV